MNENIQKCLSIIQETASGAKLEDKAKDCLDDLDFIEVIIEVERVLNVTINDDGYTVEDFNTIEDFINWMITFFPKS